MTEVECIKGHGTENDFVVILDPTGSHPLNPALVQKLANRRAGIGGDGVIRVVKTKDVERVDATVDPDSWFMDYWNADGSLAEMCGNGVRVFAAVLEQELGESLGEP